MKNNRFSFGPLGAGVALLCGLVAIQAADTARYTAQPLGSSLRIDGTSTLHDWTVESRIIGGSMEIDPAYVPGSGQSPKPGKVDAKVEISIPVRQVKSGKNAMDDVMHESMKEKQHPKVEYKLIELHFKEAAKPEGPYQFDAKGTLTVAGVTQTNTMPVVIEKVDGEKVKVSGVTNVKMTDFGMNPPKPALALGFIRTGDDVKIAFDWVAKKAK